MNTFYPGTRVAAFDSTLFVDDVRTPLTVTMKPGTVKCWYGARASKVIGGYPYSSLVDIQFDHRPTVSRGHFTDRLTVVRQVTPT